VSSAARPSTLAPPPGADMDRAGIARLAGGHFMIDATVGAVPAMLPVFTAIYGLSDLRASMILATSLLVSSATQPLFGLVADRRATPAFLWGGVAVAGIGLALAGLAGGYAGILACVAGSGLGVAAFHPEAARVANRLSAGRPATGLAWFMVGGNGGFAVGPLLAALAIPYLDARATLVFALPALAVALWLRHARRELTVPVPAADPAAPPPPPADTRGIGLLLVVTSLRTWAQFGLLALFPLLLVDTRGLSDQQAGLTVAAFSAAGAVGTVAGAMFADRVGGRRLLVRSLPLATPLAAAALLTEGAASTIAFALVGFVLLSSFSVTVMMGQEYLPGRLALAAGLMIGFGAIGSAAPGLALFGVIADTAGRDTALWCIAGLPALAGLLALLLPAPRAGAPAAA
jgi:MFS transporter, FSR family, fosmidomycin resistance protein